MRIKAAGIDIGNATTEVAAGIFEDDKLIACESGIAATTGLKGTAENLEGILAALKEAASKLGIKPSDFDELRINEAAPVIGDFAMETITETVITDSTMIGHNPDTPGGEGLGLGTIVRLNDVQGEGPFVVAADEKCRFTAVAETINRYVEAGIVITGAILKNDDGVLVSNRLNRKIPIVDEVKEIERIPFGMKCAVEVAPKGKRIKVLANPYGIADMFDLTPEETESSIQIARSLIGNRSAVVIRTPKGNIREHKIPAGQLVFINENQSLKTDVDKGASQIMDTAAKAGSILDVRGSRGTNVGGMLEGIREDMAERVGRDSSEIQIRDIFAVDTLVPRTVRGAMADEYSMEKAVGIAAMVKSDHLMMKEIADRLEEALGVRTVIGGVEGLMAANGALTTPGTKAPVVTLDIGAGSTDACYMAENGEARIAHLAGAGNMVTMLIKSELGIESTETAESIKKYPLAKVETPYHIRHENGDVEFFDKPFDSSMFAKIVLVTPDGFVPIDTKHTLEKIRDVRINIKKKVLSFNVLRTLRKISLTGNIAEFRQVILVGGTALDFEAGDMLTEILLEYGIVCGRANVRRKEGPRNAVATGLLLGGCRL